MPEKIKEYIEFIEGRFDSLIIGEDTFNKLDGFHKSHVLSKFPFILIKEGKGYIAVNSKHHLVKECG
jgi:hypothetical protein